MTVEARDQVRMGLRDPVFWAVSIFLFNFGSTNGPFFTERDIFFSQPSGASCSGFVRPCTVYF
jgi:hypothetical protein